jgi:MoxR-like ATPase
MKFTTDPWTIIEQLLSFIGLRTLYLHGPPGVGKTYAGYHYGRIQRGVYAVTLTDETSAAELRGHFIFKGGDAVWHDGPFVRAMREGARLVINEISNASADVLALLFPVLESFETARLTLPSGETVTPSEGFHVVATDNRSPEQLPEALQDRFMAYVELTTMHPRALDTISDELREIARQTIGDGDRMISARGWKHLQELSNAFEMHDACRLAFGMERGHMIADAITLAREKKKEAMVVKATLKRMDESGEAMVEDNDMADCEDPHSFDEDFDIDLVVPPTPSMDKPDSYESDCPCPSCQTYHKYLNGLDDTEGAD